MKTIIVLMLILLSSVASAQEMNMDAGAIDASSPLYGLDIALDRIEFAITLNPESRAETGLKIARERLSEAYAAEDARDLPAFKRAVDEYIKDVRTASSASIDARLGDRKQKLKVLSETDLVLTDFRNSALARKGDLPESFAEQHQRIIDHTTDQEEKVYLGVTQTVQKLREDGVTQDEIDQIIAQGQYDIRTLIYGRTGGDSTSSGTSSFVPPGKRK